MCDVMDAQDGAMQALIVLQDVRVQEYQAVRRTVSCPWFCLGRRARLTPRPRSRSGSSTPTGEISHRKVSEIVRLQFFHDHHQHGRHGAGVLHHRQQGTPRKDIRRHVAPSPPRVRSAVCCQAAVAEACAHLPRNRTTGARQLVLSSKKHKTIWST